MLFWVVTRSSWHHIYFLQQRTFSKRLHFCCGQNDASFLTDSSAARSIRCGIDRNVVDIIVYSWDHISWFGFVYSIIQVTNPTRKIWWWHIRWKWQLHVFPLGRNRLVHRRASKSHVSWTRLMWHIAKFDVNLFSYESCPHQELSMSWFDKSTTMGSWLLHQCLIWALSLEHA